MPAQKLTRRTIDSLQPSTKRYAIYDSELKGFGVQVTPSGCKSYIVEYRPGEGGRGVNKKRMALGRTNELTPDEARKMAQNTLASVRQGNDPLLDRTTKRKELKVSELIDQWDKENPPSRKTGKPLKTRTKTYMLARLKHHVVPIIGNKRVSDVTVEDVNNLIQSVSAGETKKEEKSKNKRGKISVTGGKEAARNVAKDLSSIYNYAREKRIINENPVTLSTKPKAGKREDYLKPDQIKALAEALLKLENEGANKSGIEILRLLILTGARPSEIEELKWCEVDLEGKCLRLIETKTGYSVRPLSTAAIEVLSNIPKIAGSPYVFPASRGDGHYTGSKKLWTKATKLARLSGYTRYHARHAVATLALSAGHDIASVAAIMGHSNPKTTLSTYAHVVNENAMRAAEDVSTKILNALGKVSSENNDTLFQR